MTVDSKFPSGYIGNYVKCVHQLLANRKNRIAIICLVLLLIGGSVSIAFSQNFYSIENESEISAGTLLPDTRLFVAKLDLHVDQILLLESSLNNGTSRFIITWLGHTIRSGSFSPNPSLTFYVDGFSEYEIWMEGENENTNITIEMVLTTNEYPLIYLFPIGAISYILGFLLFAVLLRSDILDSRDSKEKLLNIDKLKGRKIRFKQRDVDYRLVLLIAFLIIVLFLAVTDPYYVHNDSVGQGQSGPLGFEGQWKYEAWGYLDFAEMVRENLQNHDYNFESWAMIHGASKSIGLSFIVGVLSYLSGFDTFLIFRFTEMLFFALLCTVIGAFAYKLSGSKLGLFFGVFLTICNPVLLEYSRSLYSEIPVVTLSSLAFLLLVTTPHMNTRRTLYVGVLLCLAASFKSVLILAPIFLTLLLLVIAITRLRNMDMKYLFRSIGFLFFLGAAATFSYLLASPMKWSGFTSKFLGISQSTGWVVSNSLGLLHNLGYLGVFMFLQQPIAVLLLVLACFYLIRKRLVKPQYTMLVVLLFVTFFFNILSSRLLQHHMTYSIWIGVIIAAATIAPITKKLPTLPQFPRLQIPVLKLALVLFVTMDVLLVLPWIPYSGVYMNPIGEVSNFPPYFEPVYGFAEVSEIIQSFPNDGYILTLGPAHVLSYYLPERSVIYPSSELAACNTTPSVLAVLLSYPIQFVLITDYWKQAVQETPFWVDVVTNSGEYELIASISERGVDFVDIYVLSNPEPHL